MNYPDIEKYEQLYAKYYTGDRVSQIVDKLPDLNNKSVLDLCGGGGRLSAAIKQKYPMSRITLVDGSPAMTRLVRARVGEVLLCIGGVVPEVRQLGWENRKYAAVVCQQAINYWFSAEAIKAVAEVMAPGATFVFNTFTRCPATYPVPKEYVLNDLRYMELSWFDTETQLVQHVQVCEGMPVHTTAFQFIDQAQFLEVLSPYFDVEVINDGATAVYVCTRTLLEPES